MDTTEIIAQLDTEIARLQEAKSILSGTTTTHVKRGRPTKASVTAIIPSSKTHPVARGTREDRRRAESPLGEI